MRNRELEHLVLGMNRNAMRARDAPLRPLRARREELPVNLPVFVDRRPYLRFLLRNLLILDHVLMVLLLPFSLFTILKTLISEVTFSDNDIFVQFIDYVQNRQVVDAYSDTVFLYKSGMGLLGMFHNSIVFNSASIFKDLMRKFNNADIIRKIYTLLVKSLTFALYLGYALATSTYVCFASFFFTVCVILICIRRYKSMGLLIKYLFENSPGVF